MNIPVKITVGCEVIVIPDPKSLRDYYGVVEKIIGKESFDILIKGTTRSIHITQIQMFTFGGVWMPNRKFTIQYCMDG